MHFGPLNREGGQRRLNVAVTRAKEKLIVVELDSRGRHRPGTVHQGGGRAAPAPLSRFRRARFGGAGTTGDHPKAAEPQSPLEADVIAEVSKLRWLRVVPQVGCSGYRIDLGVIDPRLRPVSCWASNVDGAKLPRHAYGPRPRPFAHEVLERLGWRLHRVWSTEWFQRRHQELERLKEALEAAKKLASLSPQVQVAMQDSSKARETKAAAKQSKAAENVVNEPPKAKTAGGRVGK